jgi:ABC-type proline/glycine betaine transport system permease subunit
MLLEGIVEELSAFKRALRGEDRNAFDSLMNKARQHASSCTVAPLLDPMDAVFLSVLVEQQKEISSLREGLSSYGITIKGTAPISVYIHAKELASH